MVRELFFYRASVSEQNLRVKKIEIQKQNMTLWPSSFMLPNYLTSGKCLNQSANQKQITLSITNLEISLQSTLIYLQQQYLGWAK